MGEEAGAELRVCKATTGGQGDCFSVASEHRSCSSQGSLWGRQTCSRQNNANYSRTKQAARLLGCSGPYTRSGKGWGFTGFVLWRERNAPCILRQAHHQSTLLVPEDRSLLGESNCWRRNDQLALQAFPHWKERQPGPKPFSLGSHPALGTC